MSAQLYTMAGTRHFIGTKPLGISKLTVEASDFAPVVWVEIDGNTQVGAMDPTQEITSQLLTNGGYAIKGKGARDSGVTSPQFVPLALDPGQILMDKAAIDDCNAYPFKIERGSNCTPEATVTITVATPGVVSWTSHGFLAGQPVIFSVETGTLPTGLTAGEVYYVTAPTENDFSVAATKGGAPIATTEAGTATTITATAPAVGMTELFQALVVDRARTGGAPADPFLRTWDLNITGNVVRI